MMRKVGFVFILDVLSAIAAAGAAGFWWAAAAVPLPAVTDLTINGPGWQPVAEALTDQGTWSRFGAAYAGVAIGLQAVTVIARRISS